MQIKFFTIPIIGGDALTEELNIFLRTKKILQIEKQMVLSQGSAFWCFCVTWHNDLIAADKEKKDYKKVLDEATFKRFSNLRIIRKRLAQEEAIPAYAIFTDEELAALSSIEELTLADMKSINGIGEKKVEKYGLHFIENKPNATGE